MLSPLPRKKRACKTRIRLSGRRNINNPRPNTVCQLIPKGQDVSLDPLAEYRRPNAQSRHAMSILIKTAGNLLSDGFGWDE
jgi:hypothetical protein